MSINEDMVIPSSDSFWEVGKYMRTVKRVDNGYKLCDSLRQLIEQRADIEKSYSKQLTAWSKKWNDFLDKGPEYGTTQAGWKGILEESDQLSDLHVTIAERLMTDVYTSIKRWQKENYTKSMMHFKQTKELEDGFKKAQKEWEKKFNKVCMARKSYHTACRTEKSTANQENNARGDSAVSTDQLRKLQDKLQKNTQAVDQTRNIYNATLTDLNGYNPKYVEDMTEVFDKCQAFEQHRIDFFKRTFFDIHRCLDLSVEPKFSRIYTDLHSTISATDPAKDLKWWSKNHGVDMPMNWPRFDEYSPELQSISSKKSRGQTAGGDGITITMIKHSKDTYVPNPEPAPVNPPAYNTVNQQDSAPISTSSSNNIKRSSIDATTNGKNPFGMDDFDSDDGSPQTMEENDGVMVRAIYDYDKAEDDELDLKTGDVFMRLSDEDDMGWAKGKKNGRIGLYPAHYVEDI